jgi:hypothetical protein
MKGLPVPMLKWNPFYTYIKGKLTNTRHAALPVHVASAIPVEEGFP